MSEENWKLEKDLCRCCLSEGSFKNLAEPSQNQGEEEIFSDMLVETLDVNISPVAGPLCTSTYTICEECVLRLRDACSFKRQVLHSEKRFHDLYTRDIIQLHPSHLDLKQEVPDSDNEDGVKMEAEDDDDDDFRINYENDDDDNKSDIQYELVNDLDGAPAAKRAKAKKPKAKEKPKPRKRAPRPKKVKAEGEAPEDAQEQEPKKKKGSMAAKFRLSESDYARDGAGYSCGRCDKRYEKLFSLRSHVKTKHYNIPRFPCPYCDEVFMTPAPLAVHKLGVHDVDDRFKCNACRGAFNTKVQLRKHINNFHMMGERYKCELCEYESFSFEGVDEKDTERKYTLVEREGRNQYMCNICQRSFMRTDLFMQHYKHVHLKLRPKVRACYLCDVKVPGHMRTRHLEEAHGVPRPQCNACGKKFAYPFQVITHQKRYHMDEKLFPCPKCDMKFPIPSKLAQHSLKHSSIRPHKCEYCGKAFKWKKNLTTHIMMHLDDRRHVCSACGEAFVQQTSLKYHLSRKHPEII